VLDSKLGIAINSRKTPFMKVLPIGMNSIAI
jgi:hypothetical protein